MSPDMPGGAFRPVWPLHMVWLATNACNARCLHCSSASGRRTADELTREEACRMIDQLTACGVVDLGISGGEPLLRRDIFDIIAYARAQGMTIGVATNGARLTARTARRLAGLGLNRLQVSLDGLPAQHDRLRQWPGLYARAVAGIRIARDAGLRVHVCCTLTRLNADSLDQVVGALARLDIQRINLSRYIPTGRGTDTLDIPDSRWRDVIEQCMALKRHYHGQPEIVTHLAQQILVDEDVTDMPAFTGCQAGRGQGCITADGTVQPCVLLPVALGSLRQAPFADIWRGAALIQALQHRDNLEGRCGACAVRDRCGGCRALAYARTGNYLGSDPRCWLPDNPSQSISLTHLTDTVTGDQHDNQNDT